MLRRTLLIATILSSLLIPIAYACMWDYDTLAMERQEFPETLELITGKFLRHSPAFYEWRVQDREARLLEEPDNLALYDDLGVAYDKLGHHDKAIELMLKKEELSPGLYETYANLGTFYIHSGQLEKGVVYIDKAIKINPEAHFGREIYQKHLVEYVLSKRVDAEIHDPIEDDVDPFALQGFTFFLANLLSTEEDSVTFHLADQERSKAIKGILGMMRFGNHESPILLEALGDLLSVQGMEKSQLLAARAYLKATDAVDDEETKKYLRSKAEASLTTQTGYSNGAEGLVKLELEFQAELLEAKAWYTLIEQDEANWKKEGKNLDAEFTAKYYNEPALSGEIGGNPPGWWKRFILEHFVLGCLLFLLIAFFYKLFKGIIKSTKK